MLGFMNGPISGKDVFIPLTFLLGDLSQPNQGWAMLIECLSIGRGISMPALSSAVAQQCMKLTPAYARIREQFSRPIGDFEGIKDGLSKIFVRSETTGKLVSVASLVEFKEKGTAETRLDTLSMFCTMIL